MESLKRKRPAKASSLKKKKHESDSDGDDDGDDAGAISAPKPSVAKTTKKTYIVRKTTVQKEAQQLHAARLKVMRAYKTRNRIIKPAQRVANTRNLTVLLAIYDRSAHKLCVTLHGATDDSALEHIARNVTATTTAELERSGGEYISDGSARLVFRYAKELIDERSPPPSPPSSPSSSSLSSSP